MNKVILIGNGFDLAHGLKTKYSDFLLWYVNKTIRLFNNSHSNIFEDKLITLDCNGYQVRELATLESLSEILSSQRIIIKCKNEFFNDLLRKSLQSKWVDIEYAYFIALLQIYQNIEKHYKYRKDIPENEISGMNYCFELIKEQLVEYLRTVRNQTYNDQIGEHLKNESKKNYQKVLFLVFNYTNTVDLYLDYLETKTVKVIHIHGSLNNVKNPIIFGYGDEMDEYYPRIESLNINEYLRNMKSFSYFKTNNYQELATFLNDDTFDLSIMGHSCGISDRVLLNSIFCHKNCRRIRIYFYQKNKDENDYFEKTQEISRHFTLENKNRMRNMIVPLSDSFSLS
jgi:hypothetical protein